MSLFSPALQSRTQQLFPSVVAAITMGFFLVHYTLYFNVVSIVGADLAGL